MKRSLKYIVLVVLILAVLVTACACGKAKVISRPQPVEGAKVYEIEGSTTLKKINDTTLRVSCTTNLMEGTLVVFSIDSTTGEELAKKVYTMPDAEAVYADFEIDEKWEGPITGSLSVTPAREGKQEDFIRDAYGSKLENITGEDVLFTAEGNVVCFQSEVMDNY